MAEPGRKEESAMAIIKPCVFYKEVKMPDGKWKLRCQHNGMVRNHCYGAKCPHFRPTFWWKFSRKHGKGWL